jgi:hypothetical protein
LRAIRLLIVVFISWCRPPPQRATPPRRPRRLLARRRSRRSRGVQGGCTVLVLVAPDVDAMASCRIVTYLLRNDNISYQIKPVFDYGDVAVCVDRPSPVAVCAHDRVPSSSRIDLESGRVVGRRRAGR